MWKLCSMLVLTSIISFGSGCTAVVRPTISRSEFLSYERKIPASVALHVTDRFKNYSAEHFDWWCDGTNYRMEIGSFATDCFQYALESRFEDVSVCLGMPRFPYPKSNVDYIVTPRFTSFEAGGPIFIKLENYWVKLGMYVTIQDKTGEVLESLNLNEKGTQGGTIGVNPGVHLYPNICRLAIQPMVRKTVDKIVELNSRP
jgi:hypothetical protein